MNSTDAREGEGMRLRITHDGSNENVTLIGCVLIMVYALHRGVIATRGGDACEVGVSRRMCSSLLS